MSTITCRNCGEEIEVTAALQGQIEAQVLAAEHKKHQTALDKLRDENEATVQRERAAAQAVVQKRLAGEKELLKQEAAADLELAKKRLESEASSQQKKLAAQQEQLLKSLTDDAEAAKADSAELRKQLQAMMQALREEKRAKEHAELDAQKKLAEEESKIRDEALKTADEKYRLKIAEQEKKLNDTQVALEAAQRKANQGSQQSQGEVLELDLENRLREEFPFDEIAEVKKGQRGADIVQTVRNQRAVSCGIILWETKNGKWQPAWVPKFKADIRAANANIGILVSQEIPPEIGDLKQLDATVWVVSPRLSTRLATAMRVMILQVDAANKMNAGKDTRMEALYQFLVGPEFRHRIEAIIENFTILQDEIEKEKRAYSLKWARQEKAIRAVIDSTTGMYGDLQGITNRALPAIKTLELDSGDVIEELEDEAPLSSSTEQSSLL